MSHYLTWSIETADGEVELEIEYTFRGGAPATGPSYFSGGEPAEGDEIEVIAAFVSIDDPGPDFETWWGGVCLTPDEDRRVIEHIGENPPDDDYPYVAQLCDVFVPIKR